jgi:hypothetical protein
MNHYQKRNAKLAASFRPKSNPGVDLLSKAADQVVEKKSTKIAEALAKQAVLGNASAARLLVDLAEGADWVKDEKTVLTVLDVVTAWSKEPQFEEKPAEMPAGVIDPQPGASGPEPSQTYVN